MTGAFAAWGRFVHRRRWLVLAGSLLVLGASFGLLAQGGTLSSYQVPANTPAGEGSRLIEEQVPGASDATVVLILSHRTWHWSDPAFRDAARAALAPVREDERVARVVSPYDVPPAQAPSMVGRDGHRIVAIVAFKDDLVTARDFYPEVRAKVPSGPLEVVHTDAVAIYSDLNGILNEDLQRSELVSLPLTLLLLLLVFGTVVAALLPLGVGLLAVAGGLAGVMLASHFFDVSVYAVNIVTLIGLGVAIDYSLFIVSRYREETRAGAPPEDALATTLSTAGRATAFSGLTVAIGLLGLAFYKGLYFQTMGLAGAIVVAFAVLYALTFLPALLALLGPRLDRLRLPLPRGRGEGRFWHGVATRVMRRPVLVLLPTLALILLAGAPFLKLHMAGAGVNALPPDAEARRGFELLKNEFPGQGTGGIVVVADFPGDPLARERVGGLHDLSRSIQALPGVVRVQGIVDLDPTTTREQYQAMYAQPRGSLPEPVQEAVRGSVGSSVVVLRVAISAGDADDAAVELVKAIRALPPPADGRILVTGPTAIDIDSIDLIRKHTPAAVAFIMATTYLLLLVQTGSVLLPLKALVMNLLSIAASFGALVWIFQEGNLSGLLQFTPAPIDPALPVLLFCIVFGLSMDYEVLLLSRMHEEYERTGDNAQAVAGGLERSGRLITSAAGIMIVVFASFALAQVTIIKAIGLGLALAVAIDATLVRALVVPAAMRLMGSWNWWAPAWLARWWRAMG